MSQAKDKNLILKTQANQVFQAIHDRGLDPRDFLWEERDSLKTSYLRVSKLVHHPTGYFFVFDYAQGRHFTVRSPGPDSGLDKQYPGSWEGQLICALEWIDSLGREVESPDLWGAIMQESGLAEAALGSDTSNSQFKQDELEQISSAIQEIKQYLITGYNLSLEHSEFVTSRLVYLEGAAKRQGRSDWLHTSIGVLFTIVIGVGLAPDAARELFRFSAQVFRHLIQGTIPLP